MAKTSCEKMRDLRKRRKSQGMKKLEMWIYPEHEQIIKDHNQLLILNKGEEHENIKQ